MSIVEIRSELNAETLKRRGRMHIIERINDVLGWLGLDALRVPSSAWNTRSADEWVSMLFKLHDMYAKLHPEN